MEMMLIYLCLVSAICGVAHSQQKEPDLIETLELNKLVIINFLKNGDIDEGIFSLTFAEVAEQIKCDYKKEKGLVSLIQVNCDQDKDICFKQLNVMSFPSIGYFHYGEFFEYEGRLEKEALLTFISNKVGAPIKTISKNSTVEVTIKYLFNGRYNNGLVNFIRAYDLMKQHCKLQLVHTKENTSSSMVAMVTPGFNIDFDPLHIEASSLNIFSLDEVVRFVQSTLNADYKMQGNKLLFYEKIQVNVTFPLKGNLTVPKTNSIDIKIPNLKQYKLKTIISTGNDFLNILASEKLIEVWEEIKTYHTENLKNNQEVVDPPNVQVYHDEQDVVAPPSIYLEPPYYTNPIQNSNEDKSRDEDYYEDTKELVAPQIEIEPPPHQFSNNDDQLNVNVMIRDWIPTLNGIFENRTLWTRQPDVNTQYIPPHPMQLPNSFDYQIKDQSGNTYYQTQSTAESSNNYNPPKISYTYHYPVPVNEIHQQPATAYQRPNYGPNYQMRGGYGRNTYNQGGYQGGNGNFYNGPYSNRPNNLHR